MKAGLAIATFVVVLLGASVADAAAVCPTNKFACGGKCHTLPANTVGTCKAGKVTTKCDITSKLACGGRCCFSPPRTQTICLKDKLGKITGCDWGCKKGEFKCAASCWKIPERAVKPQCSTRGELIYECDETSKKACGGLCCFSPPGTQTICLKDKLGKITGCDWGCKKDEFKCAASCWKIPERAVKPQCSTRGELIYECDETSKKACGGLCCFSPPGTQTICLKDKLGKITGCDWGCKKDEFKCAYFCKKVPEGCIPQCSVRAEMLCECKPGYKKSRDWTACVKL